MGGSVQAVTRAMGSDGERQMTLSSLVCCSPPAVRPGGWAPALSASEGLLHLIHTKTMVSHYTAPCLFPHLLEGSWRICHGATIVVFHVSSFVNILLMFLFSLHFSIGVFTFLFYL